MIPALTIKRSIAGRFMSQEFRLQKEGRVYLKTTTTNIVGIWPGREPKKPSDTQWIFAPLERHHYSNPASKFPSHHTPLH